MHDDWPHTRRIAPWAVAAFIAMLWLVPFNSISMRVSLPFELHLDRIVLPFVVAAWGLSFAIGGRSWPRMRLTPVHVAVGTFVAVAFTSAIVNLPVLNRGLLVNTTLKALILLSSFATFFVIVASVIRRTEVRAFVKYCLILALVCGVGTLWEYRFHYNPFYNFAHTVLPSAVFNVPVPNPKAVDDIGRRMTLGPAEQPLELTAMMMLAVPIALVGLMYSEQRRSRILYGVAACVLLAAGVATFRKSALVTPAMVIVMLTLASPRRALRLLPLLPVMVGAVHVLAPGTIGSVFTELFGGHVGTVSTTTHRVAAYEFVRPFVWTHPLLGQGYGSYNANVERIFDSQILDTIIESGLVGLAAYLAMLLTPLGTAWRLFRGRDSEVARLALGLSVGATSFLVSSFLYDAMGFPHGPYLFLTFAALIAVLACASEDRFVGSRMRRWTPAKGVRLQWR